MPDVESKVDIMTGNFRQASEVKQRVTPEIYTSDADRIMLVSELLNKSISLANDMFRTMESSTHLASLYGVRDALVDKQQVMRDQYNEMKQLLWYRHHHLVYQLRSPYDDLENFVWGYRYLGDLINTRHISWMDAPLIDYIDTYTVVEALQHCLQNNVSIETLRELMDFPYYILGYDSSFVTNETLCLYMVAIKILDFGSHMHYVINNFVNLDSYFENSLLLYESGLNDIFNETDVQQQDFQEYWDCLAGINESRRALTVLEELIVNATRLGEQDSLEEMLVYALNMEETFHGQEVNHAVEVSSLSRDTDVCKWPYRYSAEVTDVDGNEEYLLKGSVITLMETAMSYHELGINKYERNLDELRAVLFSQQKMVPLVDLLMSYMAEEMTKLELGDMFNNLAGRNLRLVTEHGATVSTFFHQTEELQTAIETIHYYYASAYGTLRQLKLPVYTYTLLRESPLWKELLEPSPNISLEGLVYNVTNHKHWAVPFDDLFESLFEPFSSYPYTQAEAMNSVHTEFMDAINAYNEDLETFKEKLDIDNEFYL